VRLQIGDLSREQAGEDVPEGWHRIHSPGSRLAFLLAGLVGFFFVVVLFLWLVVISFLAVQWGVEALEDTTTPWGAVILALLLCIPLHELLHALWHPRQGFSPQTVAVLWPARLRFGVYYEGCMARQRWLLMRLAPFLFLSVVPAGILTVAHFVPLSYAIQVFLQVLLLVNGIGSGGDIVAVIYVLRQVPASARMCFLEGRAYWAAAR
jgi:hypothetical protein